MNLVEEQCIPCKGGEPPLSPIEAKALAVQTPNWTVMETAIEREFRFKDFREAIAFINRVADIAEAEGHHPDIYVYYNRVKLTLSTHKIGGLSRNDFILAAKIDQMEE